MPLSANRTKSEANDQSTVSSDAAYFLLCLTSASDRAISSQVQIPFVSCEGIYLLIVLLLQVNLFRVRWNINGGDDGGDGDGGGSDRECGEPVSKRRAALPKNHGEAATGKASKMTATNTTTTSNTLTGDATETDAITHATITTAGTDLIFMALVTP